VEEPNNSIYSAASLALQVIFSSFIVVELGGYPESNFVLGWKSYRFRLVAKGHAVYE